MKLKTIFIILILVIASTYSFAQSDAKEIEKLQKQREELVVKLQQKESELETAKPFAAKRINKQIDKLTEQVASLDSQISTQLQRESIEGSLNAELENENQEEVAVTNDLDDGTQDTTELSKNIQPTAVSQIDFKTEEEITKDANSESQETPEDDDPIGTALFAIGVAILLFIIWLFKRERCPHCGKKGTLRSLGDTRKYQYDEKGNVTRTGVLKRYKCSNCGQFVEKIKWS